MEIDLNLNIMYIKNTTKTVKSALSFYGLISLRLSVQKLKKDLLTVKDYPHICS